MLITTSRRPSHQTRVLSRYLSLLIPRSVYFPRGTKSLRKVIEIAEKIGQKKIMMISTEGGKPKNLVFLERRDEWAWAPLKISLTKVELGQHKKTNSVNGIFPAGKSKLATELSSIFELEVLKNPLPPMLVVEEKKLRFVDERGEPCLALHIERVEREW